MRPYASNLAFTLRNPSQVTRRVSDAQIASLVRRISHVEHDMSEYLTEI